MKKLSPNVWLLIGTASILMAGGVVCLAGGIVAANKRKNNDKNNEITLPVLLKRKLKLNRLLMPMI